MPSDVATAVEPASGPRTRSGGKTYGVSTEELIRRHQAGQPAAFDALFERYKDYVYRVAYMTLRNSDDSEEATQETFMDVLRGLNNYDVDGPARFETWLYRVTVNRCKTRLRRKRLPSADWDELEEKLERLPAETTAVDASLSGHVDGSPEGVTLKEEEKTRLWKAVNQLNDVHRDVVLLRYGQEFSYEEIAEALSINVGTVKSRLFNAHKKLQEIITEQSPDLAVSRSVSTLMLLLLFG
ncbi:MAG: sigma-70 family RNA polymerase sigma factor [Anaerolineae bacterium]|nr:sigma-70 family RNA polymerase sigma factor [Anaerolineae bacterium]